MISVLPLTIGNVCGMINKMKVVDNLMVTSIVKRYDYIMISGLAPESAAAIDLKLLLKFK
jgi:hypothetical protein